MSSGSGYLRASERLKHSGSYEFYFHNLGTGRSIIFKSTTNSKNILMNGQIKQKKCTDLSLS